VKNRGGCMLKSVEGIYRDGKIELTELPTATALTG
jgi:hypothetical protein